MDVVTYARVSKAEEGDPTSVPVQQADCTDRANTEGWMIVGEYKEEGVSAWQRGRRRPEFEAMLGHVAQGGVEAIVVRETERLLRQLTDGVRVLDLYESSDFHLIACTLEGDVDLRRARDRKDFRDRVSSAVFYSDFLSERIRATTSRKAAAGEWGGGGRRPFGYRVVGPRPFRLDVDGGEALLIRDAAHHVLGGGSLHSVVQLWNDGRAPKDSGSRWTASDVRRVLMSEQVAGKRGGVTAKWDAILNEDEHAAIVALMRDPARRPQIVAARRWALAGLVRCGRCGCRMQGNAQTRQLKRGGAALRRRYVCSTGAGGCSSVGITAPDLERHVISLALGAPEPEWEEVRPLADVGAAALRRLRELEQLKRELGVAYAQEQMTPAQVAAATEVLDREVGEVQRSLTTAAPQRRHRGHIRRVGEFWEFMDGLTGEPAADEVEGLNEWLRSVVREVRISPARAQGVRFDTSRVEVALRA
jgi:DNA invertase Pin-like site-specific DNA recombinase